jgi:hypothetical protein
MKKFSLYLPFLLVVQLMAACNPTNTQIATVIGPHTWIDAPLNGTARPPNPCAPQGGSCIDIVSHSADPLHIVQVELSVNGQIMQTTPNLDTAQTLVVTKQQWSPPGAGNYTLMVRAQNSAGVWGEYAEAIVTVEAAEMQPPLPSPVSTAPPIVVPSTTPETRPTAAAPSPLPPASIAFYADATTLTQGQCTTIHWQVANVSQVALDNTTVNQNGAKQNCPNQTTTHALRVITLDGQNVQRTLTINVVPPTRTPKPAPTRTLPPPPPAGCNGTPLISSFSASPLTLSQGSSSTLNWGAVTNADSVSIDPGIGGVATPGSRSVSPANTTTYTLTAHCGSNVATRQVTVVVMAPTPTSPPQDTIGPTISSVTPSTTKFYRSGACSPTSIKVTANVSDPSGVASVQLWYRLGSSGPFTGPLNMNSTGGNGFSITVVGSQVVPSGYGVWQFYVTARDSRGNVSTSAINSNVSLVPPCVA